MNMGVWVAVTVCAAVLVTVHVVFGSDPVVDWDFSVLVGDGVKGCACEKLSHLLNHHFVGAAIVPESLEGGKSPRVFLITNFKCGNKYRL